MKFILSILSLALLIASCDRVEFPLNKSGKSNTSLDTNIYPGNWSYYETEVWPDFSTMPNDEPNRNVILEDYTGHICSFCPAAGDVAHGLHEGNKYRIFIASVHASAIGPSVLQNVNEAEGYTIDFTNASGLELGNHFGSVMTNSGFFGNPGGTVNRTNIGGEYFSAVGSWSGKTNDVLSSDLQVVIKAKVNYYEATKGMFLHTEITPDPEVDTNLAIVVTLIEDSLVGPQNVNGTRVDDYVHRDIMRGMIDNQTWGRNLTSDLKVDGKYYVDYSYYIPNQLAPVGQTGAYNAENMHLLIYVYNKETLEIYQVIKRKIKE
jgi:hypothetical protein